MVEKPGPGWREADGGVVEESRQREKDVSLGDNGGQGRGGTFSSKKVDYNNYHDDGTDSSQHDHHLAVFPPILPL